MKRVNLLPEHATGPSARAAPGTVRSRCAVWLLVPLACVWTGVMWIQVRGLDGRLAAARRVQTFTRVHLPEDQALLNERRSLEDLLTGIRELRSSIPAMAALAHMSELVPEQAVLTGLTVTRSAAGDAAGGEPAGPGLSIVVEGVAQTDVVLAQFVGDLTASPFVNRVTARQPPREPGSGPEARFAITMTMAAPSPQGPPP